MVFECFHCHGSTDGSTAMYWKYCSRYEGSVCDYCHDNSRSHVKLQVLEAPLPAGMKSLPQLPEVSFDDRGAVCAAEKCVRQRHDLQAATAAAAAWDSLPPFKMNNEQMCLEKKI